MNTSQRCDRKLHNSSFSTEACVQIQQLYEDAFLAHYLRGSGFAAWTRVTFLDVRHRCLTVIELEASQAVDLSQQAGSDRGLQEVINDLSASLSHSNRTEQSHSRDTEKFLLECWR